MLHQFLLQPRSVYVESRHYPPACMISAPEPDNELDRIAALRHYNILDTDAENAFDELTTLAGYICGTPIALISLVDSHRQWFKSNVGLDAKETPREIAFCAHAINGPDVFVVNDTLKDERFADNPLVTNDPNVRFYAGAPLTTPGGYALGTLCAIDRKPRTLSSEQLDALRILGEQVISQLELRSKISRLNETNAELEKTKRKLERARDKAQESNRLKSQFLNTISHELRTPLTVILGNIHLLTDIDDVPDPEEAVEIAKDVEKSGEHLLSLVNDLLDLSKIEAGKLILKPGIVTSKELVADIESTVRGMSLFRAKDLDFHVVAADIRMITDALRLRQILLNLLSNAVKFTDSGRICLTIREHQDQVMLSVTDTGCGIAVEDLDHIFQPFRQIDEVSTRRITGSGLGLAITRKLSELLGGEITVKSRVDHGSTFDVTLPREYPLSA